MAVQIIRVTRRSPRGVTTAQPQLTVISSPVCPSCKRPPTNNFYQFKCRLACPILKPAQTSNWRFPVATNEPRDAKITARTFTWMDAFEEYARWMSPIGMSPRRITQNYTIGDITLPANARVFFMFGSGNRDTAAFDTPDQYNLSQNRAGAI